MFKVLLLGFIAALVVELPISKAQQRYRYGIELDNRLEAALNFEYFDKPYISNHKLSISNSPLDLLPASVQILTKALYTTSPSETEAAFEANKRLLELIGSFDRRSAEYGYVKTLLLINKTILLIINDEHLSALWALYQAFDLFSDSFDRHPDFPPLQALAKLFNNGLSMFSNYDSLIRYILPAPYTINHDILKTNWSRVEKPLYEALKNVLDNNFDIEKSLLNPKTQFEKLAYATHSLNKGFPQKTVEIMNKVLPNSSPLDNYILGWANLTLGNYTTAETLFRKHINNRYQTTFKRASLLGLYYINVIECRDISKSTFIAQMAKLPESFTFRDKQAEKELITQHHQSLLKARLLFDAKLYDEALKELKSVNILALQPNFILEYHYRCGRIYFSTHDYDNSLVELQKVLSPSLPSYSYYKAQAALDCGKIYRYKKNYEKARIYLNCAIDLALRAQRKDIEQNAKLELKYVN